MSWPRALIKGFLRVAFRAYFRGIHVRGMESVPDSGPVLFIANHPNSLLDPAILIHVLDRPIHFGAKHTLFKTPLRPILNALGAIPIAAIAEFAGIREALSISAIILIAVGVSFLALSKRTRDL